MNKLLIFITFIAIFYNGYSQSDTTKQEDKKEKVSFNFEFGFTRSLFKKSYKEYSINYTTGQDIVKSGDAKPKTSIVINWQTNFHLKDKFSLGFEAEFCRKKFDGFGTTNNLELGLVTIKKLNPKWDLMLGTTLLMNDDFSVYLKYGFKYNIDRKWYIDTRFNAILLSFSDRGIYKEDEFRDFNVGYSQITLGYHIPVSYKGTQKVKDTNKNNRIIDNYNNDINNNNFVQPKKTDYSGYSESRLQELLNEAKLKEDYEKAKQIQDEINKRTESNVYKNKTIQELNKLLEEAIKIEDYGKAKLIQDEINLRKK